MPREELYLQDIVECAAAVERFLDGVDKDKFLADEILQNAVLLKLIVTGEAAARISKELKDRHPKVEWGAIVAFRNIAVHAYFSIKWEIVWKTATTHLKTTGKQISEILRDEFPDFQLKLKS